MTITRINPEYSSMDHTGPLWGWEDDYNTRNDSDTWVPVSTTANGVSKWQHAVLGSFARKSSLAATELTGTLGVNHGGSGMTAASIASKTVSDVVASTGSGFTITAVYVAQWGRVMSIQIVFRITAAFAANAPKNLCTIKDGYKPAYHVGGGAAAFAAEFTNAGTVNIRNVTGVSLAASSTNHSVGFTYIMKA